jgi:AcrR family transcriptional regulator
MARPLAFDPTLVTDRALAAFWRLGFDGCSITDLTMACGINRQSLYNRFTDKRGLFQAALARYCERLGQALAPLTAPKAGLDDLGSFILAALAQQQAMHSGACLLVITAFGPQLDDPDIRRAVEQGASRTRDVFGDVLARSGVPHPAASADYLYAVMSGLSALSRTGASDSSVRSTLSLALETLTPKEPPR